MSEHGARRASVHKEAQRYGARTRGDIAGDVSRNERPRGRSGVCTEQASGERRAKLDAVKHPRHRRSGASLR
jgi:hypothetical protein